jgi:DNA-binding LacI/PurR family transcriptional regulator
MKSSGLVISGQSRRRTTLADVAELSGVSQAVVSQVLSGRGGSTRFSPATAARIRYLAKSLHYRPTVATMMLRENRSMTLGIALPGMAEAYMNKLLPAAIETAGRLGFEVMVNLANFGSEAYLQRVSNLLDRDVDGLMLFATASFQHSELYREMVGKHRPTVFVEHDTGGKNLDFIGMDDVVNSQIALEHLKRLGHRNVAFYYESEADTGQPSAHQRRIDFETAVEQTGLPILPRFYFSVDAGHIVGLDSVCKPDSGVTAIVVRGYDRTRYLHEALTRRGMRLPEDMSLINITAHSYENERMQYTSVCTPVAEIGRRAVEMLVEQIEDSRRPPKHEVLPGTLAIGQTCRSIV